MRSFFRRRLLVLAPALLVAGCGWRRVERGPVEVAPLRFDHLTPLKLNVAVVDVEAGFVPGAGDVGGLAPTSPVAALRQMAQDRLGAFGASGRAVFSIRQASITRARGGYDGSMLVRLEIQGGDGVQTGFAEARVARRNAAGQDERTDLHEMVRLMMDAMNVEFEFQVRRALRGFLLAADAAAPAGGGGAVERQELAPPSRQELAPPPRR